MTALLPYLWTFPVRIASLSEREKESNTCGTETGVDSRDDDDDSKSKEQKAKSELGRSSFKKIRLFESN